MNIINSFRKLTTKNRLMILLTALNFYDFATTKFIVGIVGPTAEANPAMRWIIETCGIWGILWVKVVVLFIIWVLCSLPNANARWIREPIKPHILRGLCIIYAIICGWNTFVVSQVMSGVGIIHS